MLADVLPREFGINVRDFYFLNCFHIYGYCRPGHIGSHVDALTHYIAPSPTLGRLKALMSEFFAKQDEMDRKIRESSAPIVIACWCYDGTWNSVAVRALLQSHLDCGSAPDRTPRTQARLPAAASGPIGATPPTDPPTCSPNPPSHTPGRDQHPQERRRGLSVKKVDLCKRAWGLATCGGSCPECNPANRTRARQHVEERFEQLMTHWRAEFIRRKR